MMKNQNVSTFPKENLPRGWASATIGELVDHDGVFVDGDWVESKDQDPNGEVKLIQLADIGDGVYQDRSNRYLTYAKANELRCTFLKTGDVLIARMPYPIGRTCIFPGDSKHCVTVVDVCIVRTGYQGANHRWLMYAINSPLVRLAIASLQSGSTRKRISKSKIAKLELPVPPFAEQHRIVAKIEEQFTKLDAGVELLQKVKAQLKRHRQAVLKAAMEGKLTAEWRETHKGELEPASVLLERILKERCEKWEAEHLAQMKEKGKIPTDDKWKEKYKEPVGPDTNKLQEIPKEWIWTCLGQVFEVYVGATPSRKKTEYWEGNIPWISSGEVAFCRIRKTRETISELGLHNSSTVIHPPGTVLLGMIGEGKTRGQAAILEISACNNQNSAAIRVSERGLPSEFVYYYLERTYELTRTLGSGNNQPALNKTRVKLMLFALPPLAEQQKIVEEVERRLSVADEIEKTVDAELKRAERLRQSILK